MSDEQDKISYSEGVKVNIGDYESRDVHVSYSTFVKDKEKPKDTIARARKVVRQELKKYERRIRKSSEEDVDHESMDRLDYYSK